MLVPPSRFLPQSIPEATIPTSRTRRGASVPEFALVALVFFVFVLAMFEVGRGLLMRHLLNNAARSAARFAVCESVTTKSSVQSNAVAAMANLGITISANDVNVSPDPSTLKAGDSFTVEIVMTADEMATASWVPTLAFLNGLRSNQVALQRE